MIPYPYREILVTVRHTLPEKASVISVHVY